MYKPYQYWLNYVEITNDFPCALTFSVSDSVNPILSFKSVEGLIDCIKQCKEKSYDYDFAIGFSDLTEKECKELEAVTGVYIP